jgi:hypothetical protein
MTSADVLDGARQGTDGPLASAADIADVEARVARLDGLPRHELRILWRAHHRGEMPKRMGRDLMVRAIAYEMQERAYGGLSLATKRRLRALAQTLKDKGSSAFNPASTLKPGAKLVREWHGRTHTVSVLADGYEFDGQRYRSLTMVARAITGSHRSGPRFFGVGRDPSPSRTDTDE